MNPTPKLHVLLAMSAMTDTELLDQAGNIAKLGPQSSLFTDATIANGVNKIAAKAATFSSKCTAVKDTAAQLVDIKTEKSEARAALESEVLALVGNATNLAATEAQLTSLALTPRPPVVIPTSGPPVPETLVPTYPKYHKGYFDISVSEPAGTRGRYFAQSALDPAGPWTTLSGTGKSRRVFGVSGTKVWVRFARVRGHITSDWSAPTLVVIP